MPKDPNSNHLFTAVEEGLDFLLSHFREPVFPRTIATKLTEGRQFPIWSREEALVEYRCANYLDCRISAFPYWKPSLLSDFAEITNAVAPDFIMNDLDRCNFKSMRALNRAKSIVLKNISYKIFGNPTVLWSGNGYHIYQPIDGVILENISDFREIDQPSREFLRFAESYLSDGKSDRVHNATVSLNNCMARVPGSINSKNGDQVAIVRRWDGQRPNIRLLIGSFCVHLADQKIRRDAEAARLAEKYGENRNGNGGEPYIIDWIERILRTPMTDHRKFILWMILPQYLINVRKLSYEQANEIIAKWLSECSRLSRLDSSATKRKLKSGFKAAQKGFNPMGIEKVKFRLPELYSLLFNQQEVSE
jgi:hypothetical protein